MAIIQGTSKSSAAAGYTIDQSVRFNDNDSAHLSRTPSSAGNKRTWTWSCWIKRANIGTEQELLFCGPTGSDLFQTQFSADNTFYINDYNGSNQLLLITDRVFRDPSAWFHLMFVFDTTQATSSDRAKLYINGQRETSFSTETYPSLNYEGRINATTQHTIGEKWTNTSKYLDAYLAEINFIDGTALDPSSFGETNADTGQWVPIEYTGSYGTNGFYITGADSADLGADDSGNGNDFTSSGLAAADQVSDSPTNNTATFNPLNRVTSGTFSDGNLQFAETGGSNSQHAKSTIGFTSGEKKVAEMEIVSGSSITFGICDEAFDAASNSYTGDSRGYVDNGKKSDGSGTQTTYGATYTTGDVIRIEVDLSSNPGSIEFFKNGTSQGDAFTDIDSTKTWFFWCRCKSDTIKANFGQLGFAGTPTAGFTAPTVANIPDPTIADPSAYMQTTLYTGNGVGSASGGQEINQSGNSTFQPDFVWIKVRNLGTESHNLQDVIRGANKRIQSNNANAEGTETEGLLSFDSDGFTVGNRDPWNKNTATYVGWQWLADNTTGSTNTDGSINSTVSNNSTSNFSIVKYTGTGSGTSTVGHGLGATPDMIILKHLDRSQNWRVFHTSEGVGETGFLNSTAAFSADPDRITAVSSTTFSAAANMNESADYIAYCFAEVDGFSKFGSYTGNGSTDGPFVFTGFRPKFIMYKRTSGGTGNWDILDAERDPINVADAVLAADKTTAETTYSTIKIDMLSNGYKIRGTQTNLNASGSTYIYMAFAESPFKTATAR